MPRLEEERSLAARVAGCADLVDVRMFQVEAKLETPASDGGLSYAFSSELSFQTIGEPLSLIVSCEYEVVVTEASSNPDDGEEDSATGTVGSVKFTLAALFVVPEAKDGDEPFTDDEYQAFAGTTGQMALYPYAREFIADITGRMGLPSLHIGPLRLQLDSRTGD